MIEQDFISNIVKPNTMCSKQQISELCTALEKVFSKEIKGDIIECGTWRGGLACIMLKYIVNNDSNKKLFIYDTFEGMAKPGDNDVDPEGAKAGDYFKTVADNTGETSNWCRAGIDIVTDNLKKVKIEHSKHTFLCKGKVEDTLPVKENVPDKIAFIRLDTDWYQSTKIELETFYPLLSVGGIIIIDDYNYWQGQKKAVDEFFMNLENDIEKTIGHNHSLIIEKLK